MINIVLIIVAIVLFGLIIFAHEFGHFFTAKLSGVKVNEFAIGMGPTIFKFQKGETKYSLRLFPIGGFCAMEGENDESDSEGSFAKKPVWKRMCVILAGAFMNLVFGFILMMIILVQQPKFASNTIAMFTEGAVSEQSGLRVNDTIEFINGYKIVTQQDMAFAFSIDKSSSVNMIVKRGDEEVELPNVKFNLVETKGGKEAPVIDFKVKPIEKNFVTLITQSFNMCVSTVRLVWTSLIGMITGRFNIGDMAGPVGAASAITEAASAGLEVNFVQAINNILMMMMMITVNLGIINLLPLPALDGGRFVFLVIEGIRGKPINPKYEGYVHGAGIVLLLLFMVFITYSDILRLFTGKGFAG